MHTPSYFLQRAQKPRFQNFCKLCAAPKTQPPPEPGPCEARLEEFVQRDAQGKMTLGVRGFVFGACGEVSPAVSTWINHLANMGAARCWKDLGSRSVQEARGLIKHIATQTLGIVAVHQNARLKLDRLGVAFGESGQTDGRRAADRFTYDDK